MPDIYFFPGGKRTTNFLFADVKPEPKGFPTRIAGEYERGNYALGVPFAPSLTTRQQEELNRLNLDPAATFSPFIVWLSAVPEEHSTNNFAVRVEPIDESCASESCCVAAPDGCTVEVVRQNFDNALLESTGDIASAAIGSPVVIGASGIDASVYSFARSALTQHVPTGQTMLVGVRILTPPDAGADKIACMTTRITPVVQVQDFDAPIQVM